MSIPTDRIWWTFDGGASWDYAFIQEDPLYIGDGLSISFTSSRGHTEGDCWILAIPDTNPYFSTDSEEIFSGDIDEFSFEGSGLDDMSISGDYRGIIIPVDIRVYVGIHYPPRVFQDRFYDMLPGELITRDLETYSDQYSWMRAGIVWSSSQIITAGTSYLERGLLISFLSAHKHTCGDTWTINIASDYEVTISFRGQGSYGLGGLSIPDLEEIGDKFYLPDSLRSTVLFPDLPLTYQVKIIANSHLWGFCELIGFILDSILEKQHILDTLTAMKETGFLQAWSEFLNYPDIPEYISSSYLKQLIPWLLRLCKIKGTPEVVRLISRLTYGILYDSSEELKINAALDTFDIRNGILDLSTRIAEIAEQMEAEVPGDLSAQAQNFILWKSENFQFILEKFVPAYCILLVGLTLMLDLTGEGVYPLYDTDVIRTTGITEPFILNGNGNRYPKYFLGGDNKLQTRVIYIGD